MDIGIIGSGHIGGTLARRLAAAGHHIGISNSRGPDSLRALAEELGPNVRPMTVDEAARFGKVVVVSIPFGKYRTVPAALLTGKTVIDTENYYPQRDGRFAELDKGRATSSGLVQHHLRAASVVKTFNTMLWSTLGSRGRPSGSRGRLAVPLAGDDPDAKRIVARLIDEIGFDPVDVGGLAAGGRALEPGSPVYGVELTAAEFTKRLAA